MKYYLLTGMLAIGMLSSCSNDYEGADWVGVKMQINGTIGGASTRVAADGDGSSWEAGDAIGLYTSNNGNGDADNMKFTTEAGGSTGSFTSTSNLYLLTANEVEVDAYYPYIESSLLSDGVYNFSIKDDNGDYVANDFMFATNNVTRGTAETQSVDLAFNHKMNRLQLDFTKLDGVIDVTIDENTEITCTLSELITDGTFNTKTGDVTANSTTSSVTVTRTGGTVYLIYPRQATENVELNIKIGDVYYTATIPTLGIDGTADNSTLKYNVIITGTQVELTLGGVTVNVWGTATDGGDIETSKKEQSTSGAAEAGSFSNGGSITVTEQTSAE